ncbi:MAG: hypothetical protein WCO68_03365 [Verrucomicrobiota bacterium]
MNSSPKLAPCEHITAAARRTHTKVVALYGLQRWGVIQQPYVSLIRASRYIGPRPSGIMETARKLKRMAVAPGDETGWEHVSVSCLYLNAQGKPVKRVPTWAEMCRMKAAFFLPCECVVEFHPPEADYVNNAPNCLHLWRWTRGEFPMPNHIMVGFTGDKAKDAAAMAKLLQEIGE